MENAAEIASRLYADHQAKIVTGLTEGQAAEVEQAFRRWLIAKLAEYDHKLYSKEEYIDDVIPGEITYQFDGLAKQERYIQALTAYDQLRIRSISQASYERARSVVHGEGDLAQQKAEAEAELQELRQIESRLSQEFPTIYNKFKKQISESKLDCMYVIRDGGAASLRLGREIARLKE